ncbi:MAG TPA: sulfur carrier protein ThiS [Actinocrinis sp.]
MSGAITITVNGTTADYPTGTTVETVVDAVSPTRNGIAVAVAEDVVPKAQWGSRQLRDGDHVEILTAVQGG